MIIRGTLFVFIFLLSACAAVNVRTDDQPKTAREADFEQRYHYYWWGFKGKHQLNVRTVCQDQGVEQMQTVYTLRDTVMTLFTLGIYHPRTARVWCSDTTVTDQINP